MPRKKNDTTPAPRIGEGIFLASDVANILGLPYKKVKYLMNSFWHLQQFGESKYKAVNFYTLIEFYTFFRLRELGVSASEIKKAHSLLSSYLNIKYPFAVSGIRTDGNKLWYENLDTILKIDKKKQYVIKEFIVEFLHKIEFGKNNLAERFYPLEKSKKVVVDPKHQFGQPIIAGRNITTSIIRKLHEGGESIKNITILYDLRQSQVVDALNYYKRTA